MFVAALLLTSREDGNNPNVHQQLAARQIVVCSYSEILFSRKNGTKFLIHATTWVRLETFCQSQKATYYMIPFYESPD